MSRWEREIRAKEVILLEQEVVQGREVVVKANGLSRLMRRVARNIFLESFDLSMDCLSNFFNVLLPKLLNLKTVNTNEKDQL